MCNLSVKITCAARLLQMPPVSLIACLVFRDSSFHSLGDRDGGDDLVREPHLSGSTLTPFGRRAASAVLDHSGQRGAAVGAKRDVRLDWRKVERRNRAREADAAESHGLAQDDASTTGQRACKFASESRAGFASLTRSHKCSRNCPITNQTCEFGRQRRRAEAEAGERSEQMLGARPVHS